jgi:biopolymer transport protein ExbB
MTSLRLPASLLLLAAAALAQDTAPGETMSHLSRTAEEQLAGSIRELNRLREQVAAEKLPLAQQLTAAEEQVSKLRREHDDATRLVDSGNLEIATLKAEITVRKDELDYVGNLLDEYARTFETTVHVSELQYCGEAVLAAKSAGENDTLTREEKYAQQLSFTGVSLDRLFDVVGGMRFPGVGVDPMGKVEEGQFAIIGPVALFRATSGMAGLVAPQSGSDKPLIRPLEGALQAGLGSLVESGQGLLPLDPSRGGALRDLVQKTNLIHIFEKGGPIMWPLLVASILALATVLERTFFLLREKRRRDPKAQEQLFAQVEAGDIEGAIATSQGSQDFVVKTMGYALEHKQKSLSNALMYAQAQELKRFSRGTSVLDTVITLAPLLGLLGTVTGMMGSFSLIGGDLGAPGAITGGIAEALIATAFGLGIAITALLPFNVLNTKAEEARHEIESAGSQLELLLRPASTTLLTMAPGHAHGPHLVGAGH